MADEEQEKLEQARQAKLARWRAFAARPRPVKSTDQKKSMSLAEFFGLEVDFTPDYGYNPSAGPEKQSESGDFKTVSGGKKWNWGLIGCVATVSFGVGGMLASFLFSGLELAVSIREWFVNWFSSLIT